MRKKLAPNYLVPLIIEFTTQFNNIAFGGWTAGC